MLADVLELLAQLQQLAGQLIDADDDGVSIHDFALDDVQISVGENDGVACCTQQLGPDLMDVFRYQNFCHCGKLPFQFFRCSVSVVCVPLVCLQNNTLPLICKSPNPPSYH